MGPDGKEHFDLQSLDPPADNTRPEEEVEEVEEEEEMEEVEERWSGNQLNGPSHQRMTNQLHFSPRGHLIWRSTNFPGKETVKLDLPRMEEKIKI